MEDKRTMYSVVGSAFPASSRKLCCLVWSAIAVSGVSVILACASIIVVITQASKIQELEDKLNTTDSILLIFESRLDQMAPYAINGNNYYDYSDYNGNDRYNYDYAEYSDDQEEYKRDQDDSGVYEDVTFRKVLRKKREADPNDPANPVPIYEQAYGVDLVKPFKNHIRSEGLRLYKHLLEQKAQGKPTHAKLPLRDVNNLDPILPHHRVSSIWASNKHNGPHSSSANPYSSSYLRAQDHEYEEDEDDGNRQHTRRRAPYLDATHKVKSLDSSNRRSSSSNSISNSISSSSKNFNSRQSNLVFPPEPLKVEQVPQIQDSSSIKNANVNHYTPPVRGFYSKDKKRLKRPMKKQTRRRRRNPGGITVAHFVAQSDNRHTGIMTHQWSPATWMDKLGLNRKYQMKQNSVVVRESGLYYIYAQVLGKHNSLGYQVLVDGLPVLECSNVHVDRSDSCHTSGLTYMPKNAMVSIKDLDVGNHLTNNQLFRPRHESGENSFFGMVKLMDAPETSEQLLLG